MTPQKIKFLILRSLGNLLILISISGMVLIFGPTAIAEINYRFSRFRPQVQTLTPVNQEFAIVIPKIGANAPIIPNVNPSDYNEYIQALSRGVAHAKDTAVPSTKGKIFLFAHSTDNFWNVGRYNAVFYLLKELEPGDEVDLFFNSKKYIYTVFEKKIVDALDVDYLKAKEEEEILILQTCWPPGTTWKRLLVFGRRISAD